jgi:hypothetical protein
MLWCGLNGELMLVEVRAKITGNVRRVAPSEEEHER